MVLRLVGAVAFVAAVWRGVLRAAPRNPDSPPPSRHAIRVYGFSVTAMAVAIPVGANLLTNVAHQSILVVPWVVLVVGAHFLPFAKTFHAPVFARLGWTMIAIAVVGGLGVAVTDAAAAGAGVAAGFAMLGFSATGSQRPPE
jgi:cytochrome b561